MTLKTRIIASVLACFVVVWFPSISILFSHMNNIVYEEAGKVSRTQLANEVGSINEELFSIIDAVAWICSEDSVRSAVSHRSISDYGAAMDVIEAQEDISTYMAASPAWNHLNKIVVFRSDGGTAFEYVKWRSGSMSDVERITASPEFSSLSFPAGSVVRLMIADTINDPVMPAVVAYGRVRGADAYVYAEISMEIFSGIGPENIRNAYLLHDGLSYPEPVPEDLFNDRSWEMSAYDLVIPGSSIVHFIDRHPLGLASFYGLTVFIVILVASALLFVVLSILLSRYLTRASTRLIRHIRYLMDSGDFSYTDKSIEEGDDEIASIGRSVNAMSLSISDLLRRNEALFDEKRKMEINMLQMQVNPHFLYNTLESMYYLADVQRNEGIAKMSRGLSTLLRNMAKGSSDKIPLEQELSLLRDYDEIQQVRYMGMYEIAYDVPPELMGFLIQKFTLQPLVENAIFHGIEPSGHCGTITVSAVRDEDDLVITVADDGVGISGNDIEHIFDERKHSKTDMTGVGLRNIDERIKLVYGGSYGLSFESEVGRYTRVAVRIKAEAGDV